MIPNISPILTKKLKNDSHLRLIFFKILWTRFTFELEVERHIRVGIVILRLIEQF